MMSLGDYFYVDRVLDTIALAGLAEADVLDRNAVDRATRVALYVDEALRLFYRHVLHG